MPDKIQPLTEDQIRNASPEQLRIWVATDVIGFKNIQCLAAHEDLWGEPPGQTGDPDMVFTQPLPDYPNDIAAAWQVVEKIDAGSYRWRLASKHCRSGHVWWTATLDKYLGAVNGWKEMVYAPGDTAPEAICKAALLAVMEAPNA